MRRMIALLVSLTLAAFPVFTASAQSTRYRLPTGTDTQAGAPAPSFRGGSQRIPMQMQGSSQDSLGGSLKLPSGAGGTTAAEAAMVSMGYQVHVLGEVMKPGTYRVTASDRVSEIIQKAGGFAENGSDRHIELRRKGGGVEMVDLLDFYLHGKLNENPYVTDNDVIFVPLRNKVIQVVGATKRPDVYELRNEKTLQDAIDLAGGFNAATALEEEIRIIRFKDGQKNVEELPIDAATLASYAIHNGDVIVVPNIVTKDTDFDYNVASIPGDQMFYPSYEDRVFVLGGVAFPGAYPFSPYYMVNQYISLAGGMNDRGKDKYTIISIDGKTRKAKPNDRVNPGDTIAVKQMWMSPAAWAGFALSIASFGLSASSTVIALRR